MSTFFRYVLSFAMQMAWRRAGRGGAIPPVRLPGKGRAPVNLPIIGPWQMMLASWVLQRVWNRYGSQVKHHLSNNANDLARRASQYIPDPKVAGANSGKAATSAGTAPSSVPTPTPTRTPTPTPVPTPRPTPNFNTQVLSDDDSNAAPSASSPPNGPFNSTLPQGSILGKLRGRS